MGAIEKRERVPKVSDDAVKMGRNPSPPRHGWPSAGRT